MIVSINLNAVLRDNLVNVYTAQAVDLGFSADEARLRAELWYEFDERVHHGSTSTVETAFEGGEIDVDAVWDRTLPTDALRTMVDRLRHPPPPTPYAMRHGWGPGPDGLSP